MTPPLRVGWVSLDEGDNDTARFLAYVLAALQPILDREGDHSSLDKGVLTALQAPQPPPVESILAALLNEMATLSEPLILVLDDYHTLHTPAVHELLVYLLEYLPPQAHLALSTRSDPPLPLAHLRGRGQLVELRAPDLRFTLGESATFLSQALGHPLSEEQVAAHSLRQHDDPESFIHTFSGSNRYVLDYLSSQVLEQCAPETQDFLLQISILDQLSSPLCDAVARRQGSQALLESLAAGNLFLVPLDDRRQWYRYHALFADLLRQRLEQTLPHLVPGLHRRASVWYEQQGFPISAIVHALAANEMERAADLLERSAEWLWGQGTHATLLRWAEALSPNLVQCRSRLNTLSALERIRLWFPNTNVVMAARIKGDVSKERLQAVLSRAQKKHPLLVEAVAAGLGG